MNWKMCYSRIDLAARRFDVVRPHRYNNKSNKFINDSKAHNTVRHIQVLEFEWNHYQELEEPNLERDLAHEYRR